MEARHPFIETCDQVVRQELPNLFRLYLNPYVAQTCLCLERYVQTTWGTTDPYQTFLANGFDEALSGAIKLARYHASLAGKSTTGLIIDADNRLGPFASAESAGQRVEFLPGLIVISKNSPMPLDQRFGFVALTSVDSHIDAEALRRLLRENSAILIACVDRENLNRIRQAQMNEHELRPDIVVFDESFVNRDVPFAAFTARKAIYDCWNHSAKSTFHSTTFQPNTISTLHFMNCLKAADPEFHAGIERELARIESDVELRRSLFRRLYSPSLASAIAMTGCDTANVTVAGHYVRIDDRTVLDAVGGVACSVRGHNPPAYVEELIALADVDCESEVASRLRELTGLDRMLPAVSGASAVENALKLALAAQFPKRHVLALKAGFGGKTLLALTGTWSASYKQHIDPLYGDVSYVDPFAADAVAQIDAVLGKHDVAVVQIELIQGVGGVRRVPESVVRHLSSCRAKHGILLLIDEVQSGMYRTGPFTLSRALGITPDLLVVGKAISDMMFPFALTLYSDKLNERLHQVGSDLPTEVRRRFHYPFGFKTALNVLRYAETAQLSDRVAQSGALFEKLLKEELASCKAVRELRVFGLLIGIELDATRWPQRWFKNRLFWFYLAAMLRHPRFPVLVGFCQAEPNVLKITPPLTIDADEIRQMCFTIGEILRRPFYRLLASAVGGFVRSSPFRNVKHAPIDTAAHAPVAR